MKKAKTWMRESDKNPGKTRANRWAFTQWEEPQYISVPPVHLCFP